MRRGHKLKIMGPPYRPPGGEALDNSLAIAEALEALVSDPADQRTKKAKVEEVAAKFSCSTSKVEKDYSPWKKAQGL